MTKFMDGRIYELVPGNTPEFKGVGIEIEMEALNMLPERAPAGWSKTMDGSLRGHDSGEFVLKGPRHKVEAFASLDTLSRSLKTAGTRVDDSVRAGIHIHIDVSDMSYLEMYCYATCYYILEELMVEFCGRGRSGNHFCLRAVDADVILQHVCNSIRQENLYDYLSNENIRYASLNYNSMFKFGSLEFRAMRTTTDFQKIKTWIKILLRLKENSRLFESPRQIVEQFSLGGEINFLRQVLGDLSENFSGMKDVEQRMINGVRLAQEIGYCTREW